MPRKPSQTAAKDDLHPRQRMAAEMLGSGATPSDVCAAIKAELSTIWRWKQIPSFSALVDASRSRHLDELRGELRRGARAAIGALVEIASDPEAAPAARVSASTAILDRAGLPRRSEIEATVDGTTSIRVDLTGATLEQLAALAGTDDDGDDG
jgi:hypothetical protein